MYKLDVKQERFSDEAVKFESSKQGFCKSLDENTKYHNEDDAKKLAVKQGIKLSTGMDYDQFHQMVLGANLKPIKKDEHLDKMKATSKSHTTGSVQADILMQNLLKEIS
jgi:hypothetical protein